MAILNFWKIGVFKNGIKSLQFFLFEEIGDFKFFPVLKELRKKIYKTELFSIICEY